MLKGARMDTRVGAHAAPALKQLPPRQPDDWPPYACPACASVSATLLPGEHAHAEPTSDQFCARNMPPPGQRAPPAAGGPTVRDAPRSECVNVAPPVPPEKPHSARRRDAPAKPTKFTARSPAVATPPPELTVEKVAKQRQGSYATLTLSAPRALPAGT